MLPNDPPRSPSSTGARSRVKSRSGGARRTISFEEQESGASGNVQEPRGRSRSLGEDGVSSAAPGNPMRPRIDVVSSRFPVAREIVRRMSYYLPSRPPISRDGLVMLHPPPYREPEGPLSNSTEVQNGSTPPKESAQPKGGRIEGMGYCDPTHEELKANENPPPTHGLINAQGPRPRFRPGVAQRGYLSFSDLPPPPRYLGLPKEEGYSSGSQEDIYQTENVDDYQIVHRDYPNDPPDESLQEPDYLEDFLQAMAIDDSPRRRQPFPEENEAVSRISPTQHLPCSAQSLSISIPPPDLPPCRAPDCSLSPISPTHLPPCGAPGRSFSPISPTKHLLCGAPGLSLSPISPTQHLLCGASGRSFSPISPTHLPPCGAPDRSLSPQDSSSETGSPKEFMCPECGKVFLKRHQLKYHQLKHTGELPFECKLCHRTFRTYQLLKAHRNQTAPKKK